jgi:hypothetical protein
MSNGLFRRTSRLAALALATLAAACSGDGPSTPNATPERVAVIVNSVSNSLTLVSTDSANPVPVNVGLGAQGTPVGVAVRGAIAVVPLGVYPFAAIVDLRTRTVRTAALPANSGATGAAFLNDSIAIVGNPNRNTVSPVNVNTGTVRPEVAVGTYPQAMVANNGVVFVLNGNLVNFSPAGPGSVTVIGANGSAVATQQLSGINPQAGVVSNGRLYVINAGHFGQADGSLSVINLVSGTEEANAGGFGEFPGSIDVGNDGNVYVGVYGRGILVWNPGLRQFVRGLDNPIVPGGAAPVSALAFDHLGRLHTLNPGDCLAPGKEYRLNASGFAVNRTVTTGVCPFAIAFTELPAVN